VPARSPPNAPASITGTSIRTLCDTIPCAGLLQGSHAGALFQLYSLATVRNSFHRPTYDEIDERQKSLRNYSDTIRLSKSAERLISRTQRRWMYARDPLCNISSMDSLVANQQHPDHGKLFRIFNRSGISLISKDADEYRCFLDHPVIVRHAE
jgi:hypothetical protein